MSHHQFPVQEIRSFLDESVSRINLEGSTRHSSVILVLMSHGNKHGISGTDLDVVTIQEIKSKFSGRKCPALLGKPKIFFIQACRGNMPTKSALGTDDPKRLMGDIDSCSSKRPTDDALDIDGDVPDNADIYVAYATSEGYFSIRHDVDGSWFIQSLCEELIAHVHIDDLDTMMNRVTRRVTGLTGSVTDDEGNETMTLQTPDISKQGIGKKIYFMLSYPPCS
ncbi:caspase-3-like [Strongylocentrotus purpuratus]|uniref:Caspase-3 n=1 Tax=Strongylocentrotus purpuratus TaxID=7668 RepID=A0A7M7P0L5_STRPU|nr:caspase-3-like [Strongylocentrotus purpuratus]